VVRGASRPKGQRRLAAAAQDRASQGLDGRRRFDGQATVPTRFVRACPRGHIEDLDWRGFVQHKTENCNRPLWLVERGTSGDLADLTVRCDCGGSRGLHQAADRSLGALGNCRGPRPWLGRPPWEPCGLPSRLLIRTASNARFPQVMSALSLPEHATRFEQAVRSVWQLVALVENPMELSMLRRLQPPGRVSADGLR
jgi:hypothetical protein